MAKKKEPDKLAQDAAAALAAGMSYGKWKAMQNPVKIEKPKLDEKEIILCLNCGAQVKQCTNHSRKYCGPYCAREYNRKKKKAQEIQV